MQPGKYTEPGWYVAGNTQEQIRWVTGESLASYYRADCMVVDDFFIFGRLGARFSVPEMTRDLREPK